jgi:hypothetical protein
MITPLYSLSHRPSQFLFYPPITRGLKMSDPPEPTLQLLADLAAVFAEPAKLQREIKRLTDATAATEKAQAKLVDARARHEQFVVTTTAELDERRRKIVEQELDLRRREGRLEVSADMEVSEMAAMLSLRKTCNRRAVGASIPILRDVIR